MIKKSNYSNLLDIQRENFKKFLVFDLKSRLENLKIINQHSFKLSFHLNSIKFKKPNISSEVTLLKGNTFFLSIYLPVSLKYLRRKIITKKYTLIGKIPMLTTTGNFIVNGITRVLINQIVRNPGFYVEKDLLEKEVCLTIIPYMGSWLTLKINKKNEVFAKIDKMKVSIPIMFLLQSFGLTQKKIYSVLTSSYLSYDSNKTLNSLSFVNTLFNFKNTNNNNIRSFLFSKFINKNKYNLGDLGRLKINKMLYLKNFYKFKNFLMPEDILGFTNYLIKKIYEKKGLESVDDLKNKGVRGSGDLLSFQINLIVFELKNHILDKLSILHKKIHSLKYTSLDLDFNDIVNSNILTKKVFNFFLNSQISQILDEINPLSEITHKRKITSIGFGGTQKTTNNLTIREIHPSHFGKICGIETSEGKNAGLILTFSREIRLNKFGFIETPFYL